MALRPAGLLLAIFLTHGSSLFADEKPLREIIDSEIRAAWQRESIASAPRCDDATFLRRVYLDLIGTIPTTEEAKGFLQDADANKRQKLIERLLADPRYATNQADIWDIALFGRNPPGGDTTRKRDGFKKWLAGKFAANESYDRWVRHLLTAEDEGSELFYVQFRNQPEEATVAVSRIFLGTQLQCARCHDHPFEDWTQRDFYGMAGFFVRLVVVDAGASAKRRFMIGEKSTGDVMFTGSVKEAKPGQKGEPVKPKYLGGDPLIEPMLPANFKEPDFKPNKAIPKPAFSRKEKLAQWLTAADNPYFARAVANRVWAQFMGRGFVHPVDDLSDNNVPSHPDLLDALTRQLSETKFDLKAFIRELVSSETYQLACSGPGKESMPQWFERARVRPLSAEEMQAAIRTATAFDASGGKASDVTTSYFTRYFGTPTDGQGNFQGSLPEHLFLNNSADVRSMVQFRKGNLTDRIASSKAPGDERINELFLSILTRPPSAIERDRFVQHFASADARTTQSLVEEAIWALISCSEFRFNH